MNFNNFNYKKDYDKFLSYLFSLQDLEYKKFHEKLFQIKPNLIGIRVPLLKKIAKEIAKTDYDLFLNEIKHDYVEEIMLHGFVIGYLKVDFKEITKYLDQFLIYNNNWAINDTTCANLKTFNINQKDGYTYIINLINSNKNWNIRFGLVLLLDYYINDQYIDKILEISINIKSDEYYVKMANAWLLSKCYIYYKDKTFKYLKSGYLDEFTFKKTISKICDSYRVDKKDKEHLKKIRKDVMYEKK